MSQEKPNIKDLEAALKTPDFNVFIHPELASIIVTFLKRTQLNGAESEAMITAIKTLEVIGK